MSDLTHSEEIGPRSNDEILVSNLYAIDAEVEAFVDKPVEQALSALNGSVLATAHLRNDLERISRQFERVESHLQSWVRNVRKTLSNIERVENNRELFARNPSGLLTPEEAASIMSISRAKLTALSRDRRFPQPIQISAKEKAYWAVEIEEWVVGSKRMLRY
jgi:predicted DNA-binding transcriptional regulator AlpA